MKLNLGCGGKRVPGFVGVDKFSTPAVDVRADLTETLPFERSSVDEILLDNVIEHMMDIPALMHEMHRVCRDGATVRILTPHFTSLSSWRDPTHVHHLSYFSLDHFTREQVAHYTSAGHRFEILERKLSFGGLMGNIGRLIFMLSPRSYESNWCFLFRASTLSFLLKVIKSEQAGSPGV
jgi:SAM-dependent methyltransferase